MDPKVASSSSDNLCSQLRYHLVLSLHCCNQLFPMLGSYEIDTARSQSSCCICTQVVLLMADWRVHDSDAGAAQ